jgi:hypothetical protein
MSNDFAKGCDRWECLLKYRLLSHDYIGEKVNQELRRFDLWVCEKCDRRDKVRNREGESIYRLRRYSHLRRDLYDPRRDRKRLFGTLPKIIDLLQRDCCND